MVCIAPACAEDNETAFTEITQGIFTDAESFLLMVVLALVQLFALISIIAIIVGWFTHKEKLFMSGIKGCLIIIVAAIMYFIAIEGFNYIQDNYWT